MLHIVFPSTFTEEMQAAGRKTITSYMVEKPPELLFIEVAQLPHKKITGANVVAGFQVSFKKLGGEVIPSISNAILLQTQTGFHIIARH